MLAFRPASIGLVSESPSLPKPWPSNPRAVFPAATQLLPLRSGLFFFISPQAPVPLCSCLCPLYSPYMHPLRPPMQAAAPLSPSAPQNFPPFQLWGSSCPGSRYPTHHHGKPPSLRHPASFHRSPMPLSFPEKERHPDPGQRP